MKTTSFVIAGVSVLSIVLVTSGFVLAKGKPPKPPRHPLAIGTLANNPGDMLLSDGLGPYENSATFVLGWESGGAWFQVDTLDRTAFLDLTNCVSGSCETPFDTGTSGDGHIWMLLYAPNYPLREMEHGETYNAVVSMRYVKSKFEEWTFRATDEDLIPPQVHAKDTDGDDSVDEWVFTVPPGTEFSASKTIKNKSTQFDSRFNIPFTITAELK